MKNKSVTFKFFKRSLITNILTMLLPMIIVISYSFFHIIKESNETASRNNSVILSQIDATFENFFTDIDNAYLVLATDSDISERLSEVFEEESLSLSSIRFIEILSANFRNIVFTNSCVQNIYFYINNDDNKILTTLNKRTTILNDEQFSHITDALTHDERDDIWFEVYDKSPIDIGQNGNTLQIYRRLYYRATRKQSGLIVYSINLNSLSSIFSSLFNYDGQILVLFDSDGNYFFDVSNGEPSKIDFSSLKDTPVSDKATISLSGKQYFVTTLKSERSYGPTYVLLTPASNIYRYASTFLIVSAVIFLCVLISTAVIAIYKTNAEYKKVSKVIDILATPSEISDTSMSLPKNSDPFSYIQFNIMKLFIEQDYLKVQNLQKNTQLKLSQIQALQHQINPHFLNNTLNIIYWKAIALGNGENECSSMIQSLSDVMRYSLSNPQEDALLCEEIVFIKKYISLMKKRFPNVFEESIEIEETCTDFPIKKMLLQPLVENAINHGLRAKDEKGNLVIKASTCAEGVIISVFDDGVGIAPEVLDELNKKLMEVTDSPEAQINIPAQHIGILNTQLRLVLAYGKTAGLSVESKPNEYTSFSFVVPNNLQ